MAGEIFNPSAVYPSDGQFPHTLGQRLQDHKGHEWMFIKAQSDLAVARVVVIKSDYRGRTITFANADEGYPVGVLFTAIPSGQYGWASIYGKGHVHVNGGVAAGATAYTSAGAGSVDDNSSSQTQIIGMVFTAARSNAGNVNAMWSYPVTHET